MRYSTQAAVNMHLMDRWAPVLGGIALTTSVLRRKPVGEALDLLVAAKVVLEP